jgi:hypothetical protein
MLYYYHKVRREIRQPKPITAEQILYECILRGVPLETVMRQSGFIYANTDNEETRRRMEDLIVLLLREGVKP